MKVPSKMFEIARKLHLFNALRDLVLFVQFKRREKHPWRSVT